MASSWLMGRNPASADRKCRPSAACVSHSSLSAVFQGDSTANRPEELLLVLQAVGGAGGRTRTRPPVVRKLGHNGNQP